MDTGRECLPVGALSHVMVSWSDEENEDEGGHGVYV